jgi:hypothetical protein
MAKSYEDINGRNPTGRNGGNKPKPRLEPMGAAANVSWGLANPEMLAWVVSQLTQGGNAVIFGTTRDGGALSVTVLYGEQKEKYYITPKEDINQVLKELGEYYGS